MEYYVTSGPKNSELLKAVRAKNVFGLQRFSRAALINTGTGGVSFEAFMIIHVKVTLFLFLWLAFLHNAVQVSVKFN